MPPLYNAYEAKLLNVLHSKICKEKKRKMISLSWATCPFLRKVVYFQGRPAHTYSKWSIFRGDRPTHTQSGLFSGATAHTLTLVYFYGRPAHTYSLWFIFRGNLPTLTRGSIFTGDLPFWLGLPKIPSGDLTRTKSVCSSVNLKSPLAIPFNQS